MIITRTPFRISFVGGGSDLESFYRHYQGMVLSSTINKYMYISSHQFFDETKIRLKYSKTETVDDTAMLEHPIAREILKKFNIQGALEISSNADVPSGTGLGSSSAFTVGLLHNLHAAFSQDVDKGQLAQEACDIEINKLQEPIGKQDQYAAAFGGLNIIRFNSDGTVAVEPLRLKTEIIEALQDNLMIFYTGQSRATFTVLSEQDKNLRDDQQFRETLKRMVDLVPRTCEALQRGDLYKALNNGAVGGKLLGAGGGGIFSFLLRAAPSARA